MTNRSRNRLGVLALAGSMLAWPRPAPAWDYVEHLALGTEAYRAACEHLRAELSGDPGPSAEVATRLEIACDNLDIVSELYGQATALAGDRFERPEDFLSTSAGWKAASRKQYLGLALANSTHFHPYAPREWRRYHAEAMAHALAASHTRGLDAVDGLQRALYENAFADHFLADSFSAGHMGFNRSASSVAASLAYHDAWNRKGRVVRNRRGESWRTYGDGRLDATGNADGRAHVLQASTLSIEGLLRAFVTGKRDSGHELDIWRALPFVIEAPELPSLTDRMLGSDHGGSDLHPLGAINWPARKDRVIDLRTLVSGPIDGGSPIVATLIGFHVSLPLVSTRIHLGLGAAVPHGPRDFHFAADIGLTSHLGLTNDGVLDHQLGLGALWEARTDGISGSLWGGYLLNVELGRNLVQLQVGPALLAPEREIGFAAAIGFARVLSAAGGGVR